MRNYVSLHNHTEGSLGLSITTAAELIKSAKEAGQSAVAITDSGAMREIWPAYKIAQKEGIKLIAGCEMNFVDDLNDAENTAIRNLVVLAKNGEGYKNLMQLHAQAADNFVVLHKKSVPRIDWALLEKYSEGLICTSSCGNGVIGQYIMADKMDEAKEAATKLKDIFGEDFALELQPHNLQRRGSGYSGPINQQKINMALKNISEELGIKCIVATNSHYTKKEHHKFHDAFVASACGQPVSSGQRLAFDKQEFYIKTSDEVYNHFVRHMAVWGEEFVESLFTNAVELADKCEEPVWIDPAVATGDACQLPEFPYKEEYDYSEFKSWKKRNQKTPSKIYDDSITEDAKFYRYRTEKWFDIRIKQGKIPESDRDECIEQMLEEFGVFEFRGFSSYMLITADFLNWCRSQKIPIGPGRGCLTGDTNVFTGNGFKHLSDVSIGDKVYTHNGRLREVFDKFKYDVNEEGIEITTDHSFDTIKLTSDHKCFASKRTETDRYLSMQSKGLKSLSKIKRWNKIDDPSWIRADSLSENDLMFMPFPNRNVVSVPEFNLEKYIDDSYTVSNEVIIQSVPLNNELSIRSIVNKTGLSRSAVQNAKKAGNIKASTKASIEECLLNCSFDEWVENENVETRVINKTIRPDEEFMYFIGRWVGDGWLEHSSEKGYTTGMAFHKDDKAGIARIECYLNGLGFKTAIYHSKDKKLSQLICKGRLFYSLIEELIPDYERTSKTKHLPKFFRTVNNSLLRSILLGLQDSDGHIERAPDYIRESIDTTSKRLALEVKESLLYLKIPSSISVREPYDMGEYRCSRSYKLRFRGLGTDSSSSNLIVDNGYFCKIKKIETIKIDTVYDISVKDDTSYLTSNYAVHNSVGGSLTAFVNGIHQAYPKAYNLIFARFLNRFKDEYPDIDNDVAPSGRGLLQDYLREKYGNRNVAAVSNLNTITPKVYAKDIARVFEFGGMGRSVAADIGNNIADSLPAGIKTIQQALVEAPLFAEYAKQYPELAEYQILCGKPRSLGTHAAGLVISKRPIDELMPLRRDISGNLILEHDKVDAEELGQIKLDVLGLKTLDLIKDTYKIIEEVGKTPPPNDFQYEDIDDGTYDLISEGDTFGVFQLTGVAAAVCKKLRPRNISDLAIITSLIRPGAAGIINDFMKVRHGETELELMHPNLDRALGGTYGYGIFEECLMFIAADVAGWDLHKADALRKMTKAKGKYPEKIAKLRTEFINDALKNKNVKTEDSTQIWDEIVAGFGDYAFNRCLQYDCNIDTYTSTGNFIASKSIENIKAGEYVRSRDEQTGGDIFVEVLDNHDHGELDIVEVELDTGEKVRCTMNHKFRVKESGEMLPLHEILKRNYSLVLG